MKTILKMLEDPASDNTDIDYLIWCFIEGTEPVSPPGDYGFIGEKYTTSLDAAMSIGAEELEGWYWYASHNVGIYSVVMHKGITKGKYDVEFLGEVHSNMPRAICHARIQALEYVRKEKP